MRFLILVSLVGFFFSSAKSQFAVSGKYGLVNTNWNNSTYTDAEGSQLVGSIYENEVEFGLSYWFRLKEQRVEFYPELSVGLNSSDVTSSSGTYDANFSFTNFYLNLNTQVYFMDFKGDCNCPTWSKDGNFLTKGLYLLVSPSVVFHNFEIEQEGDTFNDTFASFRLGAGVGLDIGLNDLLTISPFYTYYFSDNKSSHVIDRLTGAPDGSAPETNLNQNVFGLKLVFRPDYRRSQNRFRR